MADTEDPLKLLRQTARNHDPQLTEPTAADLRDEEIEATRSAQPAPGIDALLSAAERAAVPVGVVSNNSAEAVSAYLLRHGLDDRIQSVIGRYDGMPPALPEAQPTPRHLALDALRADPTTTTLIGDSSSDGSAAHAASVSCVGFAHNVNKASELELTGADAISDDLTRVAAILLPRT
jgi:phosphoglycolate phosphatase-like HAD superfamily hydrolase